MDYGLRVTDMDRNQICGFIKKVSKWKIDVNGDRVCGSNSVIGGIMGKYVLMPVNQNFHAISQ